MFKKGDFVIFGIIVAVAVFLAFCFSGAKGKYISVTVENEKYGEYPLSAHTEVQISSHLGTNTLVIENGSAHFEKSDCHDKICENTGEISRVGETIVCLPHKVVAEVKE